MFCTKCGKENDNNHDFCIYCGATLVKTKTNEPKYCGVCGFKLDENDTFCPNCGYPVSSDNKNEKIKEEKQDKEESLDYYQGPKVENKDDQSLFIINNTTYYKAAFKDLDNGKKYVWNWFSFLFGPLWFFYRKMCAEAVIITIILYALSLVSLPFAEPYESIVSVSITIVSCIILGFLGNSLYKKRYDKIKERTKSMSPEKRKFAYSEYGGTSVPFIFLGFALYIILRVITSIISLIISGGWQTVSGEEVMIVFNLFIK